MTTTKQPPVAITDVELERLYNRVHQPAVWLALVEAGRETTKVTRQRTRLTQHPDARHAMTNEQDVAWNFEHRARVDGYLVFRHETGGKPLHGAAFERSAVVNGGDAMLVEPGGIIIPKTVLP